MNRSKFTVRFTSQHSLNAVEIFRSIWKALLKIFGLNVFVFLVIPLKVAGFSNFTLVEHIEHILMRYVGSGNAAKLI